MTKPIWPLGSLLVEGFSAAFFDDRHYGQAERGLRPIDRISSQPTAAAPCSMLLTLGQFSRLEDFYYVRLRGGRNQFYMKDPIYYGARLVDENTLQPILQENGGALLLERWWLIQFGEQPPVMTAKEGEDVWRVEFELERQRRA